MGQYFKPVNLDKKEFIESWDLGCGAKLMEHSYIGNSLCNNIEMLLVKGGRWNNCRLVWAGDYAEREINQKICEVSELQYLFDNVEDYQNRKYYEDIYDINLFCISDELYTKIKPKRISYTVGNCVFNHTKKEYYDKFKCKMLDDGLIINPLPLLCADSEGSGGSYYVREEDKPYYGRWCGDKIGIDDVSWSDMEKYTEIIPNFMEEH